MLHTHSSLCTTTFAVAVVERRSLVETSRDKNRKFRSENQKKVIAVNKWLLFGSGLKLKFDFTQN
jgi:hypothetical protein